MQNHYQGDDVKLPKARPSHEVRTFQAGARKPRLRKTAWASRTPSFAGDRPELDGDKGAGPQQHYIGRENALRDRQSHPVQNVSLLHVGNLPGSSDVALEKTPQYIASHPPAQKNSASATFQRKQQSKRLNVEQETLGDAETSEVTQDDNEEQAVQEKQDNDSEGQISAESGEHHSQGHLIQDFASSASGGSVAIAPHFAAPGGFGFGQLAAGMSLLAGIALAGHRAPPPVKPGGDQAPITLRAQIALGPVTDDGSGTKVTFYNSDGFEIPGDVIFDPTTGYFTLETTSLQSGKLFVRVIDNDDFSDYMDEATGEVSDMPTVMWAATEVSSTSQTNFDVTVSPLTTLAALMASGGHRVDEINIESLMNVDVVGANKALASLFGMGLVDLVREPAAFAIDVDGRPQVPNGYGIALAVVSTFQHKSALGPDEAIDSLGGIMQLRGNDIQLDTTHANVPYLRQAAREPLVGGQRITIDGNPLSLNALSDAANSPPSGSVTISGTAMRGEALTASADLVDRDGIGELSYQWLADGQPITGAIGATFVLERAQIDKVITVLVSYIDDQGTVERMMSSPTRNVTNGNEAPSISETALLLESFSWVSPEITHDDLLASTAATDADPGDKISFVIRSVGNGMLEKWNNSNSSWVETVAGETSLAEGEKLRWSAVSTAEGDTIAFTVIAKDSTLSSHECQIIIHVNSPNAETLREIIVDKTLNANEGDIGYIFEKILGERVEPSDLQLYIDSIKASSLRPDWSWTDEAVSNQVWAEQIRQLVEGFDALAAGGSEEFLMVGNQLSRINTITSTGSFVNTSELRDVDVLLVGGGGAGGSSNWGRGGGGGGGQLTLVSDLHLSAGRYAAIVGAGGTSSYSDNASLGNGSSTFAFGATALGGGGGDRGRTGDTGSGAVLGTGGGGGIGGGIGTIGGNSEIGSGSSAGPTDGGGGGGAGGHAYGANGGVGVLSDFAGQYVLYGMGGSGGGGQWELNPNTPIGSGYGGRGSVAEAGVSLGDGGQDGSVVVRYDVGADENKILNLLKQLTGKNDLELAHLANYLNSIELLRKQADWAWTPAKIAEIDTNSPQVISGDAATFILNAGDRQKIYEFKTSDNSENLTYRLIDPPTEFFEIDHSTGSIFVSDHTNQVTSQDTYELSVEVRDEVGHSTIHRILVSALDNGSSFSGKFWTGTSGDDNITLATDRGMSVTTGAGNDTINAYAGDAVEVHIYAGIGDDIVNLHFHPIDRTSRGHHIFLDDDHKNNKDVINFFDLENLGSNAFVAGRIEDFHPDYDIINIDGAPLDLYNLPDNVKIVNWHGRYITSEEVQQWLVITAPSGGVLMYTLNGARLDPARSEGDNNRVADEDHFITRPDSFGSLKSVPYVDPYDYIPKWAYELSGIDGDFIQDGRDVRMSGVLTPVTGSDKADVISGGLSGDIIEGLGGDDYIFGGSGDDHIWGGAGNDILYGGPGSDKFYIDMAKDGFDSIKDFSVSGGDKIVLALDNMPSNFSKSDDLHLVQTSIDLITLKYTRDSSDFTLNIFTSDMISQVFDSLLVDQGIL